MVMYPPKVVFPDFSCGLHTAGAIRPENAFFVVLAVLRISDIDLKRGSLARLPWLPEQESKERSRLIHFWTDDSRRVNSGGSRKCGFQLQTSGGLGRFQLISISRSNGISLVPRRSAFAHRRGSVVWPLQAHCHRQSVRLLQGATILWERPNLYTLHTAPGSKGFLFGFVRFGD